MSEHLRLGCTLIQISHLALLAEAGLYIDRKCSRSVADCKIYPDTGPPVCTSISSDVFGCEECGAGKKLTTVGRQPRCGAVNLFIVLLGDDNSRCGETHPHTGPMSV